MNLDRLIEQLTDLRDEIAANPALEGVEDAGKLDVFVASQPHYPIALTLTNVTFVVESRRVWLATDGSPYERPYAPRSAWDGEIVWEDDVSTTEYAECRSTFQNKPAYRYLRKTDRLPGTDDSLMDVPFDKMMAPVRLFNPTGVGTWHICAYDPETGVATGVADLGFGPEFGDIWMQELVDYRGRFGLPIERDLHWKPVTVAEILAGT